MTHLTRGTFPLSFVGTQKLNLHFNCRNVVPVLAPTSQKVPALDVVLSNGPETVRVEFTVLNFAD